MIRNIFITVVMSAYLFDESTGALKFKKITGQSAAGGGWGSSPEAGRTIFPWIVALAHIGTQQRKIFCGGTLISKSFVLSGEYL